ncbi:MAG: hypothetical protein AAFY88_04820, partial [Acidobacteriota bacterium]
MKKVLIAIALLSVITAGGVAFAQASGPQSFFPGQGLGQGAGPGAIVEFIQELDLREDQVQYLLNIQHIVSEARGRHAEFAGDHLKAVADKLESGETFAEEDAEALIDLHFNRAQDTANDVADQLVRFLNSLDPDQKALVAESLDRLGTLHAVQANGGFGHGRL